MAKLLPVIIKILWNAPWGKIISLILKIFGEKKDVKEAVVKNMPENLPRQDWMKIARGEIGVKEIRGRNHNKRIVSYHQSTSLKATTDEVPWCASFVCWVLEKASLPSTRSARARSYEDWGQSIMPTQGAIVVLWRGSPSAKTGHVGFYMGDDPNDDQRILMLGGNQSDAVNIKSYPKDRVLSYRWPE